MSWVQESRGWPSWLAPEVLPDARGGWRADEAAAGSAFTRTKAQSPGLSPAGDADGKAKREAATGDRSTGTSGTEGGRRGGRSSVTAGQARQTPAREPIRHFCQRKKARPEQRKDLRGTQGRRRPGGRHCGNISFRWGSLPKERASLRNTRAGDSVWWPQRKASDEVTVHCLTSTGIASPRATLSHPLARQGERGMGSRARQGARPAQSHGEDHYKEKNPNPFSFFFFCHVSNDSAFLS